MNFPSAFLCGLGHMGLRHLHALIDQGYQVDVYDPSSSAVETASKYLSESNYIDRLSVLPSLNSLKENYSIAIFSEPAKFRLANFKQFLRLSKASKMLLEKPLSSSRDELKLFFDVCQEYNICHTVQVHFIRRSWPHIQTIKQHCMPSSQLRMSVNGGAVGLGCNGIHFIELFLYFNGYQDTKCTYSRIDELCIASGRGSQYSDYGGTFILESSNSIFSCSLSSYSAAKPEMSVYTENLASNIDYQTKVLSIQYRDQDVNTPVYLTGKGFSEIIQNGDLVLNPHSSISMWIRGQIQYPTIIESILSHQLLFDILDLGKALKPYSFT